MTEYVDVTRARTEFKEALLFDRNFRRPSEQVKRKSSPVARVTAYVVALAYFGIWYWVTK